MQDEIPTPHRAPLALRRIGLVLALIGGALALGAAPSSAQSSSKKLALEYAHDTVLPFRFRYPEGWTVNHADPPNPAHHWLEARPNSADRKGPRLRAYALGSRPYLVGRADLDLQIRAILTRELSANSEGKNRLEWGSTRNVGARESNLRGAEYTLTQSGVSRRGLAAWAEIAGGLLILDLQDFDSPALRDSLLASFEWPKSKADVVVSCPKQGPKTMQFRAPADWPVRRIRTGDQSKALQLDAEDRIELVIRSIRRKSESAALDADGLRRIGRRLLVREGGQFRIRDFENASFASMPGGGGGLTATRHEGEVTRRLWLFERGGALHVSLLESRGGFRSRAYTRARRVVASLRGPDEVAAPSIFGIRDGRFVQPLTLVAPSLLGYANNGEFRGGNRRSLTLQVNGRYRQMSAGEKGPNIEFGSYRVREGKLELDPGTEQSRVLSLDEKMRLATENGTRTWLAEPILG